MEEIQDAIEDAQYMLAMNDDSPKPSQRWKKPTKEQMELYFQKLSSFDGVLDAKFICSSALGFYMVIQLNERIFKPISPVYDLRSSNLR
jgi:hypothetical protein